jgi:hypothetical protein
VADEIIEPQLVPAFMGRRRGSRRQREPGARPCCPSARALSLIRGKRMQRLGVLVGCCAEIGGRGGSFALAGPLGAVLRILAVTGPLCRFEAHDSVDNAVTGSGPQRPAISLQPFRLPPARRAGDTRGRFAVNSEVSMSQRSAVAADHRSLHGGETAPALGWWLS